MMNTNEKSVSSRGIAMDDYDYPLPEERIARFPVTERDASRLLVWQGGAEASEISDISETTFGRIGEELPAGSLLVFNDTRVVRARLVMHKQPPGADSRRGTRMVNGDDPQQGARIELLCLEPSEPADYERAFAACGRCEWLCMVGNLKRWTGGACVATGAGADELRAWRVDPTAAGAEQTVRFEWSGERTFSEMLELAGRVPIPPYLGRDSEDVDNARYQTVYAEVEGSVAAPTAGLHFTPALIERLGAAGIETERVTLHVGAGTFLPVKTANALEHPMHTERFEVTLAAIERLGERLRGHSGRVVAVGTTSVRTLESLPALAWRIERSRGEGDGAAKGADSAGGRNGTGDAELDRPVGQFEPYDIPEWFDGARAMETLAGWMRARGMDTLSASTRIMITPAGFRFRVLGGIVTNFHQPRSTLLLLIAAFTGGDKWLTIYDYALSHGFRFLSYGDSSLLLRNK